MRQVPLGIVVCGLGVGAGVKLMTNQVQIYKAPDNNIQVEVRFEEDTVWLTQAQIIELFDSSKANISEHISHVFDSGELDADSIVRKFRTVQKDESKELTEDSTCSILEQSTKDGTML
jgi:hypothetical protein